MHSTELLELLTSRPLEDGTTCHYVILVRAVRKGFAFRYLYVGNQDCCSLPASNNTSHADSSFPRTINQPPSLSNGIEQGSEVRYLT